MKKILYTLIICGFLFSCEQSTEEEKNILSPASEIPVNINYIEPMPIPSIEEITEIQFPFYFIDADNYLHPYRDGGLVCPQSFNYQEAQYIAFLDLNDYSGIIALAEDTLLINDGIVDYASKGPAPGRATCNPGDIKQSGTAGQTTTSCPCSTGGNKSGTQTCTINTVSCLKQDGSTYTAKGSPGDLGKCKKNKQKGIIEAFEIESECGG